MFIPGVSLIYLLVYRYLYSVSITAYTLLFLSNLLFMSLFFSIPNYSQFYIPNLCFYYR